MLRNSLKLAAAPRSTVLRSFPKISVSSRFYASTPDQSDESQTGKYINTVIKPYTATTYARPNLVFTHGKGCYLYDLENREYIDFSAGIAVTALGHSNPEITEIIADQAKTLMHCSNLFHNLYAGELANKLVTATKEGGGMHDAQRVFLCNSGTEANEAAIKFARRYGKTFSEGKSDIISFENAFHGRSLGALSITPNPKYQDPFKPLLPGCPTASVESLESVKKLISKEKTAAVIIEPIQGEGGVKAIPLEFLIELKKLCKENNALLIYDEIQCGLGRTGKLWAHSSLPVEAHPDILTMAKALGNGFPIGATMISEEVEKVLHVGDHGTTYGGNPLGSRIGSFVVEKVSDEEFLSKVEQKSEKFVTELKKLQESKPDKILEVRGRGLLLGLQFAPSIDVGQVSTKCRENGLIVITAGQNVLRLVPALNIDDEVIDKGLNILRKVIEEL